jgi:translation initiation factor 5
MSKGPLVNIPRDVEDSFYRYKMPVLKAKVEGKGNGIKTVIENMAEIAKAMERPPEYPTKFFGFELGLLTKCEVEQNKYVVNGKHDAESLSQCLDKFIEKYVLCKQCRNPETELTVKGEIINSKCRACGKNSTVDMGHKLSTYILKNAPGKEKQQTMATAQKKAQTSQLPQKVTNEKKEAKEDEVQWSTDTSQSAVEARRRELLGARDRLSQKEEEENGTAKQETLTIPTGTNPIPVLKAYFKTEPEEDECVKKMKNLVEKHQWSETTLLKYIFAALFTDADMRAEFYKKAQILSYFSTTEKEMKIILYCLEKHIEANRKCVEVLPHVLNGFYENCILDEERILKWYTNPNKKADIKLSKEMRDRSKPFIEWLRTEAVQEESDNL